MKVMGIVTGRHNGNSEILVKEALLACQEEGAEVELINLFDYNILPCTGCEVCTMSMGNVAMGKGEYTGCVLKEKDDMDKLITEMQTCNGLIIGVPTYDLMPSTVYTRFTHRFLAYEAAFLLKIGKMKEDPNQGLCPNCHSDLIMRGDKHWDGIQWPFECVVCGAGGDIEKDENGDVKFVIAEDRLCRDRNVNECREKHLEEIVTTRIDYMKRQGEAKKITFPTVTI